jgi:Allophanate hydrolase C-terminal domain
MDTIVLAVNGTLMRGLELNQNLLDVEARFVEETFTSAEYRLWTINDVHPAMQRVLTAGQQIMLELWDVPVGGISNILMQEPPGLCIGKVTLVDGRTVLGVLGEAALCAGQKEITEFGGWRKYREMSE